MLAEDAAPAVLRGLRPQDLRVWRAGLGPVALTQKRILGFDPEAAAGDDQDKRLAAAPDLERSLLGDRRPVGDGFQGVDVGEGPSVVGDEQIAALKARFLRGA